MDVDERVVLRFNGFADECQTGLLGGSTAFLDIAFRAGTNDVSPNGLAAHASGDDVVEGKFAGGESFAAILASVLVAGEDISAIELDLASGQAVIK